MANQSQPRRRKSSGPNPFILNAGTYGLDGGSNDDGFVGWDTAHGHIALEPPEKRHRKSTIPWDAVTVVVMTRLWLHGVPSKLHRARRRQQLRVLIEEALDKLGVQASKSSVNKFATELNDQISEAERLWDHNDS